MDVCQKRLRLRTSVSPCLVEVTKQLILTDIEVSAANAAEGAAASAAAAATAAAAAQAAAAAMAADISTDGSSRRLLGSFISARDAQNSQQTMTPAAVGPPREYHATARHAFHAMTLKDKPTFENIYLTEEP